MEELYLILMGAGISFLVQIFKKTFKKTDPLLIVAILSVFVGGGYALLKQYGLLTGETLQTVKYMFASSIVVFNVLRHFAQKAAAVLDEMAPDPEQPAPEVSNPDQPVQ